MAYRSHDKELYKRKLAAKQSRRNKHPRPGILDRVERWARIAMKSIVVTSAIGIIGFALYTTVFDSGAKEVESERFEWVSGVTEFVAAPMQLAQDGLFGGRDAPRSTRTEPRSSPPPRTEAPRRASPRTPPPDTTTSPKRSSGGETRSAPTRSLAPGRPATPLGATATAGFENKPPGGGTTATAGADGADGPVAADNTATTAPGKTTPPADPLIARLLAAEVFQPRDIRTELIWPASDMAFTMEAKLDPATPDSASTGLVRRATATLIGKASRDGRQVSGPFDQSDSGKDVWVFRGTETVSNPLQIPVYFLGERFRTLTLLPARVNRNNEQTEAGFKRQRLGDLTLHIRTKDGYGERLIPGTDLEQRLIRNPEGGVSFLAWLICDGPCDRYRDVAFGPAATAAREAPRDDDACAPHRAARAADWQARGAPDCLRSFGHLDCAVAELERGAAALDRHLAPARDRVQAATALCGTGGDEVERLAVLLGDADDELRLARPVVDKAADCVAGVDAWLQRGFRCASPDCTAAADRAALTFLTERMAGLSGRVMALRKALLDAEDTAAALRRAITVQARWCGQAALR